MTSFNVLSVARACSRSTRVGPWEGIYPPLQTLDTGCCLKLGGCQLGPFRSHGAWILAVDATDGEKLGRNWTLGLDQCLVVTLWVAGYQIQIVNFAMCLSE